MSQRAPSQKLVLTALSLAVAAGCTTAPKVKHREKFVADARMAKTWLEEQVTGLSEQTDGSAAYIIFPAVGQWGTLFGGGKYGRGIVCRNDDTQIGWAAINTSSLGLQAGVMGFKMLIVLKDETTLNKFKKNKLTGSVSGAVLVGKTGVGRKAPFENGVAVYQGGSTGLLAGVNVGLDYVRFQSLDETAP